MTWTNAFDVGECYVGVIHKNEFIYSAIVAKGETTAQFDGYLTNEKLTVSVTSDGAVQLNWISGNGPADGYILGVYPTNYSIGDPVSLRVSGIVMPEGQWQGNANAFGSVALTSDDEGATWSPDPAEFTGSMPEDGITVDMGYGL